MRYNQRKKEEKKRSHRVIHFLIYESKLMRAVLRLYLFLMSRILNFCAICVIAFVQTHVRAPVWTSSISSSATPIECPHESFGINGGHLASSYNSSRNLWNLFPLIDITRRFKRRRTLTRANRCPRSLVYAIVINRSKLQIYDAHSRIRALKTYWE